MNHGSYLGDCVDPWVHDKWQWRRSPLDYRLYKRNGDNWLLGVKRFWKQYYCLQPVPSIPTASIVPVSIGFDSIWFQRYISWASLSDGMDTVVDDPIIPCLIGTNSPQTGVLLWWTVLCKELHVLSVTVPSIITRLSAPPVPLLPFLHPQPTVQPSSTQRKTTGSPVKRLTNQPIVVSL